MASQEYIRSIAEALGSRDLERAFTLLAQLAAKSKGDPAELCRRVQEQRSRAAGEARQLHLLPTGAEKFLVQVEPYARALVLDRRINVELARVVDLHRRAKALAEHGLEPPQRLLFHGPPGCGKTSAARALASDLDLPCYVARTDAIVESYMGHSAANMRKVMGTAQTSRCMLFLDEVDAVGMRRPSSSSSACTETRRITSSVLTMLEERLFPGSVVVAATNTLEDLDPAMNRRFDLVLRFPPPNSAEAAEMVLRRIPSTLRSGDWQPEDFARWGAHLVHGLKLPSHAEVERLCLRMALDAAAGGTKVEPGRLPQP